MPVLVAIAVIAGCADSSSDAKELSSDEAKGAVRNYFGALDEFQYRKAWSYLGRNAKDALGMGYGGWSRSWKRNYRMKLGSVTVTPRNATTATVAVTLNRLDFDACNNKVWQTYSGNLTVNLDEGLPLVQAERVSKIAGPEPVAAISACQTILPPPPTEPVELSAGGGDLDCPDIGHPLRITGSDPHGLDANGDGIGCESE